MLESLVESIIVGLVLPFSFAGYMLAVLWFHWVLTPNRSVDA